MFRLTLSVQVLGLRSAQADVLRQVEIDVAAHPRSHDLGYRNLAAGSGCKKPKACCLGSQKTSENFVKKTESEIARVHFRRKSFGETIARPPIVGDVLQKTRRRLHNTATRKKSLRDAVNCHR